MKKKATGKIVLIILSIILVVIAISTATYAVFFSEQTAPNPNDYSTGLLSITASSKSETISLSSAIPKTDEEGLITSPYVFTIKNIGNLDYNFNIKLLSTSSNTISPQYIKLQIDDGDVTTLSALSNSIIKEDITLKAQESIDIKIRIWLSIDTPNSEIGKTFNSQIVADGKAIYTTTNSTISGAIYIMNLYNNATKTQITNNSIKYNYATSLGIMNDRKGGVTPDLDGGNLRYYGANPNNYIYFNCTDYQNQDASSCELWRIIGIFDGKIKLIRNEALDAYAWDTSASTINSGYGVSDWTEADLMKLLNPGYEANTDLDSDGNEITVNNSLYWNSQSGSCYVGSSNEYINAEDSSGNWCDFTSTGIKNESTKNLISLANWPLYSPSGVKKYSDVVYNEDTISSSTWTGKIGLLSLSDYAYSTNLSSCTSKLNGYSSSNCKSNSWLVPPSTQSGSWTINGNSSSSNNAYVIKKDGQPSSVRTSYGRLISVNSSTGEETVTKYYVRPVLYLNESVVISSGEGTESSPYQIISS